MRPVPGHTTRAFDGSSPNALVGCPVRSPLSPAGRREQRSDDQAGGAGAGNGSEDVADDHEQHGCDQASGQDCDDAYDHDAGSASRFKTWNGSRACAAVCRGRPTEHDVDVPAMGVDHTAHRVVDMLKSGHLALLEEKLAGPAGGAVTPGVGVLYVDFYGCRVSVGRIHGLGYMEGAPRGATAECADSGAVASAPSWLHDPRAARGARSVHAGAGGQALRFARQGAAMGERRPPSEGQGRGRADRPSPGLRRVPGGDVAGARAWCRSPRPCIRISCPCI